MVSDKDCTGLECGVQLGSSFYDVCTVGDCVNLQYCRSVPLQTREKGSKSKKNCKHHKWKPSKCNRRVGGDFRKALPKWIERESLHSGDEPGFRSGLHPSSQNTSALPATCNAPGSVCIRHLTHFGQARSRRLEKQGIWSNKNKLLWTNCPSQIDLRINWIIIFCLLPSFPCFNHLYGAALVNGLFVVWWSSLSKDRNKLHKTPYMPSMIFM